MNDILKIVQTLEDSNFLLNEVAKTIKNETRKQKRGFLGMVLGTLEASLLGNMLAGKSNVRAGYGNEEGKGMLRAGSGSKKKKKNSASTSSFKKLWNSKILSKSI